MNAWTTSTPGKRAADRGDDPAARTPHCTPFCILFFGTRLHEIACDVANRRDPILDRRIEAAE